MYDVIIVGSGTVGLTLANLFSPKLKILVLDQGSDISKTFKATGIDDEVLRLFQQVNITENIKNFIQTIEIGFPIFVFKDWHNKVFLRLFQETGICGYNRGYVFCQEEIDKILFEKLQNKSNMEILFNQKVLTISEDISTKIVHINTKNNSFRAKYIVGCDGADGIVSSKIKANKIILNKREKWIILNILEQSRTNNPHDEKEYSRVSMCISKERNIGSIALPNQKRRIEISIKQGEEYLISDDGFILEICKNTLGHENFTILFKTIVQFENSYYSSFQNANCNIFIAGDAAHRSAPFLGQGLGSGLRDVNNLYWRIESDLTAQNQASKKLLMQYSEERTKHQKFLLEETIKVGILSSRKSLLFYKILIKIINILDILSKFINLRSKKLYPQYKIKNAISTCGQIGQYFYQFKNKDCKIDSILGSRFTLIIHNISEQEKVDYLKKIDNIYPNSDISILNLKDAPLNAFRDQILSYYSKQQADKLILFTRPDKILA